jgi:hypothetical protein
LLTNPLAWTLIAPIVSSIGVLGTDIPRLFSHARILNLNQSRATQSEHSASKRTISSEKHSFKRECSAMEISRSMLAGASLIALGSTLAMAQQVTGVPRSPEATTTITVKQLPPPHPKYGGVIRENASASNA